MSRYKLRPRESKLVMPDIKRRRIISEDEEEEEEELEEYDSEDSFIDDEDDEDDEDTLYKNVFKKRLMKTDKNLNSKDLNLKIDNTLDKFKGKLDEYIENICNNTIWKVGLDEKKIREIEPKLEKIKSEIAKQEPTLEKILNAKLPKLDKERAIKLFDILQNTDKYTIDYLELEEQIQNILLSTNNLTDEDIYEIDVNEERFRQDLYDNNLELKNRIFKLETDDETKSKIYSKYLQMIALTPTESEYHTHRNKLEWLLSLPYQKTKSIEDISIQHISNVLNEKLYGLENAKERLLEILNNKISNPNSKSMIALEGSPGTGKTRIASVLAEALDMPFERISLGGVEDPGFFKGSESVFVGSAPSIILQILKRMKYCNGIILFDEIDKLGASEKGKAVQYALLHITDYIQNKEFCDMFLNDFPHDLSKIIFAFSLNSRTMIDSTLLDRLDIIEVVDYTTKDKIQIIQRHLLKDNMLDIGITDLTINDEACKKIITLAGESGGLRTVDKLIHRIISKINFLITQKDVKVTYDIPGIELPYEITVDTIDKLKIENKKDERWKHFYS